MEATPAWAGRLEAWVRSAAQVPGTLVPIESLVKLIDAKGERASESGDFSPETAAPWLSTALGKKIAPATVRKYIRDGLQGVKLEAYPLGRSYGITLVALRTFRDSLRDRKGSAKPARAAAVPLGDLDEEVAGAEKAFQGVVPRRVR